MKIKGVFMKKLILVITTSLLPVVAFAAGESCGEKTDCNKTVYSGNVYAPNMQVNTSEKTVTTATLSKVETAVVAPATTEKVEVATEKSIISNSKMEHQNIQIVCAPQEKIVYKPKVVYKDRIVYKEKIVYRDREVEKMVPVVKEVEVPKEVYVTKEVTKLVEKPVTKIVEKRVVEKIEPNKNSLSLIGVMAPTRLETHGVGSSNSAHVHAENEYEPNVGVMYQRDFSVLRLSVGATTGGIGLLGLGFNF